MITEENLSSAGRAVARHTGLSATGAGNARLEARLRARCAALGMTPGVYVAALDDDPDEAQNLVDHLTIQETSFFRDAQHFDALVRNVVPGHRGPVTLWSAGCATGAEPYSLAMALDEAGIDDFQIVATDISRPAVERVRGGWYRESELRGLSAARRGRYLIRSGDGWQIDPALCGRVTVAHHNLLVDPVPIAAGNLVAVFCRNVFIYLERKRIADFLGGLRHHLVDDGVVFVGGSESIWSVPEGYRLDRIGDAFCYRRVARAPAPAPAPAPVPVPSPPTARPPVPVRPVAVTDDAASDVDRHRRAVYSAPDDVLAHVRLGLALEESGDHEAGRRAFRAALAALRRADHGVVELDLEGLEGYDVGTLRTMLDVKVATEGPSCRR